jgi:hypothetical protein
MKTEFSSRIPLNQNNAMQCNAMIGATRSIKKEHLSDVLVLLSRG